MPNSSAGWPDIRAAGRKGGGTFGRDLVVFVPVHADFLVDCVGLGNFIFSLMEENLYVSC